MAPKEEKVCLLKEQKGLSSFPSKMSVVNLNKLESRNMKSVHRSLKMRRNSKTRNNLLFILTLLVVKMAIGSSVSFSIT